MNRSKIQTKRLPHNNKGLSKLYTRTKGKIKRKKRQNAATSVGAAHDIGSESPSLGVARALMVILLLHVGAIAAIFIHSQITSGHSADTNASLLPVTETKISPRASNDRLEKNAEPISGAYYHVKIGDTYQKIADRHTIPVTSLRKLNNNVMLSPGMALLLPEGTRNQMAQVAQEDNISRNRTKGDAFETLSGPMPVREDARGNPNAHYTYEIKKGDTIWTIARRYGVSRGEIMKMNGITDPRKLRLGQKIKVPKI